MNWLLPTSSAPYEGTVVPHRLEETSLVVGARLVLAVFGLFLASIDKSQIGTRLPAASVALVLYVTYSLWLYIASRTGGRFAPVLGSGCYWADVAWYGVLVSLTNGANSVFFFGFYFAILVAAFRLGFPAGIRVTTVSALTFSLIGCLFTYHPIEPDRLLLRVFLLLLLGYMISRRGGFEVDLTRRLMFLKEVLTVCNPRFGIDRTVGVAMERLREFYQADHCLLVLRSASTGRHIVRRAVRSNPEAAVRVEEVDQDLGRRLLAPGAAGAVIFSGRDRWQGRYWDKVRAFDTTTGKPVKASPGTAADLAAVLDTRSYAAVPVSFRGEEKGRLYITSRGSHTFKPIDLSYLLQVIDQVAPVIENIRLMDTLASDAADQERRKIAQDIHDSLIQPYIGLQIGLAAVAVKNSSGMAITADLEKLIGMAETGVGDLREQVSLLRRGNHSDSLRSAVRGFAAKFAEYTGIAVEVNCEEIPNDRLSPEVFQMVTEGLSNIRRHTTSRQASVDVSCRNGQLQLKIVNQSGQKENCFVPRSLRERAEALGGKVGVGTGEESTTVLVEIPL
ncbi:MAG: hypothetical protein EHM61_14375 [Acidobacteria bacterium]|nr:MAG: hypothetical protein EHM61_14375 [Acidobacteriota bacterium]